jgi:FixJ family two-component response regulator
MRAQVVVTDVQMPFMDGWSLLAALHSIEPSLPVIVLTAGALSDTSSVLPGAFRVIQKPVAPETILSAVTEALVRQRVPRDRMMANAARAIVSFGRVKVRSLSRAVRSLRPRAITERSIVLKRPRRRRAALAVVAGFGAAAAAAVLIATLRGLAV